MSDARGANHAEPADPADLADEARRIAGAVQGWLEDGGAKLADAGRAAGPDCEWCPICRLAAVIRAERPEVTERLAEASAAVSSALKALVDAASAHLGEPADRPEPATASTPKRRPRPGPAPSSDDPRR